MNIKKVLMESIWIYIFVFVAALAGYFVRVLYARNFTLTEYGLFYAVFGFIFLFRPFRELGFGGAQLFYTNKFFSTNNYSKAKGIFIITLLPQILLSFIIAAIILFLKPFLVNSFFKNPLDFRKARTGLPQFSQNVLCPREYSLYPAKTIFPLIVFLQASHL